MQGTSTAAPTHAAAPQAEPPPLTMARAAWIITSVTVSVTIISGVLIHFTDKKLFPNIGDGL
jgi:hypothetical protein